MFKKEELGKNFKFQLGMKFNSLVDFKDAMIEYLILIRREVKFPKNDKIRVRVLCKSKGCSFKALVSQVENNTTFKMKTFERKHTCGRVFNNKTANSKWLTKKVDGKLLITKKVWLNDIINDMKKTYSIRVIVAQAWRAKKMT